MSKTMFKKHPENSYLRRESKWGTAIFIRALIGFKGRMLLPGKINKYCNHVYILYRVLIQQVPQ
ncbi:unnamed protein product, partial [Nesidiocoris tenuis]